MIVFTEDIEQGQGNNMANTPPIAIVPVKTPASSTINWVSISSLIASIAAYWGLSLDPATITAIILGIQAVQTVYTVIRHTFFEDSVISASLQKK